MQQMLSRLPGPSLRGRLTLYTSVTVLFLRTEHSVTDSGRQDVVLCFASQGARSCTVPSKWMPFIIRYLTESMHGITASKERDRRVLGYRASKSGYDACAFIVPAPINLRSGLSQG